MSKFVRFSFACLLVVAICALSVMAQSQASTGQITGVVTDTNGAAVSKATVKATNKDTGLMRDATTSDDGVYTIVLLPPGKYTVTVESSGFANATIEDVIVTVGQTANVAATLGASAVQATVMVTAEAVQVTRNETDAVINEVAIRDLPINGRRFQDFVTLTPTAQVDPSRGQISLAGQKGINGNVNIDGLDYNQPFFGGIRGGERSNLAFTVPQESIKEFQVISAGYSAEFGRSSGGIVNAVTKSGDNSLRGSAFWLFRPSRLARGNEFTQALSDQRLTALGITPTLAPTQHQFGGSIGGRIVKDKLFYFGSFEKQRFRAPRQIVFAVPTGFPATCTGGCPQTLNAGQQAVLSFYNSEQTNYIQTNDAWAGLVRLDWNVSDSHRLNIRGSMSRNNALNAASRGETSVDPTTRQAFSTNGTEQDKTKLLVFQDIVNFGATVVNELRFQAAREDRPRLSNSVLPQILTSFSTFGAGGSDTSSFLPNFEYDTRYQVADAVTYIKGNHNFKFGGEYSRLFAAQTFGFNQFGQYNASLGAACIAATNCTMATSLQVLSVPATPSNSQLGRFDSTSSSVFYQKQIGNLAAALKVHELAFFGQDSWRVTKKLTINYGFRAEQQYNPEPDTSNTQIVNVVKNTVFPLRGHVDPTQIPNSGWQWGPRLGFAYDPKGEGRTVIRGFGGLYYARTPLIWIVPATQTFRATPADVSTRLPFAVVTANQTAFNTFLGTAAGANYIAITGCNPAAATGTDARNRCTPNTLFRQFAIVGINLNSFGLNNLPILSNQNIADIAGALGLTPSPFVGAQVIPFAEDYKNPRAAQFGIGFEHQVGRGLVIGIDYANVSTHSIGRFRDVNIPTPLTAAQYVAFLQANNTPANFATMQSNGIVDTILAAGRTYIAVNTPGGFNGTCSATVTTLCFPAGAITTRQRPTQAQQGFALGSVGVHESSGKSLYRGLTFRARLMRKHLQLNTYYTISRLLTDDDNERQEGVGYADPYDLSREYYVGRLNRESLFMANPIVFLPFDFEVAAAVRLRSGAPFNPTVGADLNGDTINNDRPLLVPGVPYPRNYFTNGGIYDADLRVQKSFKFGERQRLVLSSEFFNILNRPNLLVGTSAAPSSATAFGSGGQFCNAISQLCGLSGGPPSNPFFLQTKDPTSGSILINNVNPGSGVFQMQVGVRFQF